jgi:intracellular septation protein A
MKRGLLAMLLSIVVFFAVRTFVGSDAAALAVAGAAPAVYAVVAALVWHRVDPVALLSAAAFAIACVASLLLGGNSLPLKLPDAALAFVLGVVLLVAVVVRRPLPIGRVLKAPPDADATLGVLVGGFLMLHALLHLMLALTLSTAEFVTLGRLISWATLGVGALCLFAYLRRLRKAVPAA